MRRVGPCVLLALCACAPAAIATRHAELAIPTSDAADASDAADTSTTWREGTGSSAAISDAGAPPRPAPPPEHHASVYPVIRFEPKATTVPEEARVAITLVVSAMRADSTARVVVRGSAEKGEPKGTALARAKATARELTNAGIAPDRVQANDLPAATRSVEFFEPSGDRFSVLYTEWDAYAGSTRRSVLPPGYDLSKLATDPVVFFMDDERPDTAAGRAAQAEAKKQCAQCNGDWGIHGLAPIPGCVCRAADAHKPCKGPRDCSSTCEISWEDALHFHGSAQLPPGRCAEFYGAFGCRGWIVETDGGRDTQWICRD
jgi:hypothetical protein